MVDAGNEKADGVPFLIDTERGDLPSTRICATPIKQ
jgi:hypothetical protein